MTTSLSQVFERASTLPPDVQDELAAVLTAEIDSELRWEEQFAKSADVLSALGRKARDEYRSGQTEERGFDEL